MLLEDFVKKGQNGIDIFPYIQRAALDIILETAMGVSLSVQTKRHSDYLEKIEEAVQVIQQRQFIPWYMSGMVTNSMFICSLSTNNGVLGQSSVMPVSVLDSFSVPKKSRSTSRYLSQWNE